MPLRHGTGAATSSVPSIWRRGTGGAGSNLIDHMYRGTGARTYENVYSRAVLPTITSFTITPDNATAASAATIAAAYNVPGTTTAGRSYNYGSVMTAGQSSVGHFRTGWSQTHGFGSVNPGNQAGNLTFVNYFASTPSQTVGDDLNRRYFVRTNFSSGPDFANRKTATTLSVNGINYPLSARGTSGWTSAQDVPAFVSGSSYNIQVTFSDGTTAWPNTQTATVAGTTTFPTVEIIETLAGGGTTTHATNVLPEGTISITRPSQDASFNLVATNAAGSAHIVRHFDFRTALSGLAIDLVSHTGDLPFNADSIIRLRFRWTGDPGEASVTVQNYAQQNLTLVQNGSTHQFTIPRGAATQTITWTLLVSGVNANNQSVGLSTTRAIVIPSRGG